MSGKGNFPEAGSGGVVRPRFLADEMLGRLARYLRMLGCDTLYARGCDDETIARLSQTEGRILLTRDRELAARAESALRIRAIDLPGQLRELAAAFPSLPRDVAFERCTLCNGLLQPVSPASPPGPGPEDGVAPPGVPVFACASCGHRFWEGSHTASVRRNVGAWIPEAVA